MTRVYLSGKMTGLPEETYARNFARAQQHYESAGFEVINPCNLSAIVLKDKPDATYEDFMQADLEALRTCTHIAMIAGWEDSPGAKREKTEAERLGLEIMQYKEVGSKK